MSQKSQPLERLEKWIQTPDDWYPTFPHPRVPKENERCGKMKPRQLGFVRVFFSQLSDGQYRVSLWGGDDHGLELDQPSRMEALELYRRLPNPVTHEALYSLGFNHA